MPKQQISEEDLERIKNNPALLKAIDLYTEKNFKFIFNRMMRIVKGREKEIITINAFDCPHCRKRIKGVEAVQNTKNADRIKAAAVVQKFFDKIVPDRRSEIAKVDPKEGEKIPLGKTLTEIVDKKHKEKLDAEAIKAKKGPKK